MSQLGVLLSVIQSTGFTVKRIAASPTSVSAVTVNGSNVSSNRSMRGSMSETVPEACKITEDVFVIDNGTRRGSIVQPFVFSNQRQVPAST